MFTLKFFNHYEDGSSNQDTLTCHHYSIYRRNNGTAEIVCYKDMTSVEGVSRGIMKQPENGEFECCYIENSAGKTIDTVRGE